MSVSAFSAVAIDRIARRAACCLTCKGNPVVETVRRPEDGGIRVVGYCHGAIDYFNVGPNDGVEDVARRAVRMFARSVTRCGQLGQPGRLLRAARPRPRSVSSVSRGG